MNLSLQAKITCLALTGLATGLGIFSWLGMQAVNDSTERTLEDRLTLARVAARHLDDTLNTVLAELQSAAESSHEIPVAEAFDDVALDLRNSLAKSGIVVPYVVIVDRNGRVTQAKPDGSELIGIDFLEYSEVNNTLTSGQPTISGLTRLTMIEMSAVLATVPIYDEHDERVGALSAIIDTKQSSIGSLGKMIVLGNTGYAEIVDNNGVVVYRSEPGHAPEMFEMSDHPARFAELINEGETKVGTCHRCHLLDQDRPRDRDVLAFAPTSSASWGVAIRQSEEEALAPTRLLKERLIIGGAVILVGFALLVWLVVRGVVRPIKMLTAATAEVAQGDFKTITTTNRRDEIGQLGAAFNAMTSDLYKSKIELELHAKQLSAVNSVASAVAQSLDIEEVLDNALRKVAEVTGGQNGCIFLRSPVGVGLNITHRIGSSNSFNCDKSRFRSVSCVCMDVLQSGQARFANHISQCAILGDEAATKEGISCFVSIPLKAMQETLGVMNVECPSQDSFTESDSNVFNAIGFHVGLAIDNCILYGKVRENEQLRGQLLEGTINSLEEERKRIARELHDEYGQTLTGLIWVIESANSMTSSKQSQLREQLAGARSIATHALETTRRLALDLRPPDLDDLGLAAAIRTYVQTHLEDLGVHVDFKCKGLDERLSPLVETALFRIVQEAIHNIIRHAEAHNAKIVLKMRAGKVEAIVEDDGRGFNVAEVLAGRSHSKSLGLLGIRERVTLLNGKFDIKSKIGEKTRLIVEIPLDGG